MQEHTAETGIRINTIKGNIDEVVRDLQKKYAWNMVQHPTIAEGWLVDADTKQLTQTDEYIKGLFYIQNFSSLVPARELRPVKDAIILDMCAAPGSKTTHLAALMENTGTIIASDTSRDRLYKLQANLKRMGVTNVQTVCADGRSIWKRYPEYFDGVLLDAPCSMDQALSRKKIKLLANRQQWLLRSAVSATKPGGTVVYSTCTANREENEDVINWIRKKEGNAIAVETERCIQKDEVHESFFIARLHKTKSTIVSGMDIYSSDAR